MIRRVVLAILAVGLAPRVHAQHLAPDPIPAAQQGSGTSWLPASTPIAGHATDAGEWHLMLHYNAFAGVIVQGSDESLTEAFTANWVMGMAQRPLWNGTLLFRSMLSAEPLLLKREGYPLLLQTGETAHGYPLVDRQHAHDLFMELATDYTHPLGASWGYEVYAALSGEPALGPVAFMHRASAERDPFAPIGHHWQDSTHIAFGVLTAGVHSKRAKLEGSWFNAREPDEHRLDLDLRKPESYSGRLTWNPTDDWSAQISYGKLVGPEALEPDEDITRITASATYNRKQTDGNWASTFVWGRNETDHGNDDSYLLESNRTHGPHAVFGRLEHVEKNGHEYGFDAARADEPLPVSALSAGYTHTIARFWGSILDVGGVGYVGHANDTLERERYGTSTPASLTVFIQLRPMGGHVHHPGMKM